MHLCLTANCGNGAYNHWVVRLCSRLKIEQPCKGSEATKDIVENSISCKGPMRYLRLMDDEQELTIFTLLLIIGGKI